jgi:hypothetical protein
MLNQRGFGGITLYLGIALAAVIFVGGAGFYFYWDWSQGRISALTESLGTAKANQVRLEGEIVEQNQSIRLLEQQQVKDQRRMLELADVARVARLEVDELRQKFKEHDLDRLSNAKPGLIENIINKGTRGVWDDFEGITKLPTPPKPAEEKASD